MYLLHEKHGTSKGFKRVKGPGLCSTMICRHINNAGINWLMCNRAGA